METLPKGWVKTALDNIATWGAGGTPKRTEESYYGGEIPWIKTGDLGPKWLKSSSETITLSGLNNSSAKLFKKGSVAIAMYGATIGKTSILDIDAATNQACAVGKPFEGVTTSKFLYYLLNNEKQRFIDQGKGGAQPNISQTVIRNHEVAIPSLEEQQRIVSKVEDLLGQVTTIQNRLNQLPEIINQFRQSVLAAAVSGQLTEEWRQRNCEYDTPEITRSDVSDASNVFDKTKGLKIPKTWRWERFLDLGLISGGGTPKKSESKYWGGDIPWVSPKDMKTDYIGQAQDSITREGLDNSSTKLIPAQSILFVVRGMILAHSFPVAINVNPVTINQDMKAITPINVVEAEYLVFVLMYKKNQFVHLAGSSTHGTKRLESKHYFNVAIPVPPQEEQKKIVRQIKSYFAIANTLETSLKNAKAQVDNLTQSILAKAFRGELVRQQPDDEPAEVLLEKIAKARAEAELLEKAAKKAARARKTKTA